MPPIQSRWLMVRDATVIIIIISYQDRYCSMQSLMFPCEKDKWVNFNVIVKESLIQDKN